MIKIITGAIYGLIAFGFFMLVVAVMLKLATLYGPLFGFAPIFALGAMVLGAACATDGFRNLG